MDDRRFDAFVRQLASGQSRRSVLKGLLGLGGVALTASTLTDSVDAARRPEPTPKAPKCPQRQHWDGVECVCDSGDTCGSDCCSGSAVCCDNACCNGECYGEELCCPTGQIVCDGECCPANSQCCTVGGSSVCAPASATCCADEGDCPPAICRGDLDMEAYYYLCVDSVCVEQIENCQGDDECTNYGCFEGACTAESRCRSGEFCCDDGSCSSGGLCGCTIDGEYFPPYVEEDCPAGVSPTGEPPFCGCAQVTGQECGSTDECLDALGEGICLDSVCFLPFPTAV